MTEQKIYRSAAALETIARNTLKAYDPMLVAGEPAAIPIERIVEHGLGINVEYRYLRKQLVVLGCTVFDDTQLGVYIPDESRYALIPVKRDTIVIDERLALSDSDGRLRFTFAHELAHWLIHKELYSGSGLAAANSAKTSGEEDISIERQADILASALLMPAGQVKRAFYRNRSIAALAQLFGVSKQAMSIFLRNHNLT
jgi:hypothetical protein